VDRDPAHVGLALDLPGVQPGMKLKSDTGKLVGKARCSGAPAGPSAELPDQASGHSVVHLQQLAPATMPNPAAHPVEPTMSMNSTVASTRLGSRRRRIPVKTLDDGQGQLRMRAALLYGEAVEGLSGPGSAAG
jgi:hypothetical protein